ncbi:hypothetical protein UFOVP42_6 [uncultured Caudovirales phage]|uniref:Uncharacterized protein n=1 Tax=uncultured Caudovirales phage TaxID=2100421 RepID=A0A6J5KLV5_9CAUD|nr:hypothetical protein UFOVP42_6 [uncultured Caudovirales phage]
MNANELNKWIENSPYTEQEEVIVLLRQQQAEIDEWKYIIERLNSVLKKKEAEIEALKADNEQMCKALFRATRAILRKAQEK